MIEIPDYEQQKILDPIKIRLGFIRKVYGILSFQLAFTAILSAIAVFSDHYQRFILSKEGQALLIFSSLMTIVILILIACFERVKNHLFYHLLWQFSKRVPYNYICLTLFTVFEAITVSFITGTTSPEIVFMATVMTTGIVLSLTAYAVYTKRDFTMLGGALFLVSMGVFLILMFSFFSRNSLFSIIISGIVIILFGFYLIYDTQLIIGGRQHEISMDDYIIASIMLYIDIITIFIYLIRIMNESK